MWYFFFNDTATTEIYTLSLHDALPIFSLLLVSALAPAAWAQGEEVTVNMEDNFFDQANITVEPGTTVTWVQSGDNPHRSEEHTSELQSRQYLVCRLLLEKKKPSSHKTT